MLKRLAARGKQPPGPVTPGVRNTNDHFEIGQSSNEGGPSSPVSPDSIFMVTVYTLDDDQKPLEITVQRDSDGQWLFEEVCELIGGVQEKDYFGLRFLDHDKQRQWVDLSRNCYRQLKHMHPCCVSFRVKHYPPNPLDDFKQEISKYFLFLQLKRDILHSRLLCQGNEAYELAAYIAQADIGDYEDVEDPETYLSEVKLLPNQSPKSETKIAEIHKTLKGLVPCEAEATFLELASKMETYGIDPYSVKDQKGNVLYLGLTHVGVVTFQGSRRAHIFKWSDITKFNYNGKLFIIHVTFREDNQFKRKKKHILGFKCESSAAALSLWRWAVDRYCFFTLKRSSEAKRSKSGGGLFRRSHTFRFSGRCQREALSNSHSLLTLPQPEFKRDFKNLEMRTVSELKGSSSFRREDRGCSSSSPEMDKYATFPRTKRQNGEDAVLTAATSSDLEQISNGDFPDGDNPPGSRLPKSKTAEQLPAVLETESDKVDEVDERKEDSSKVNARPEGDLVESIVVPVSADGDHAAPPHVENGISERGVDVGEDRYHDYVGGYHAPKDAEEARYPNASMGNDIHGKGGPIYEEIPNHHGDVQKDEKGGKGGRSILCVGLSTFLLSAFVGVGFLILLFEIGPEAPITRPLVGAPGAVLEDWRQEWYLPLRNKFLPLKH